MKRPLEGEAVSQWKKVSGRIYHVGAYRRGIRTFLVVEKLLSNERVRVLVFKPWARRPRKRPPLRVGNGSATTAGPEIFVAFLLPKRVRKSATEAKPIGLTRC